MQYIELKNDLTLSEIGLGCWQFSKGIGFQNKRWRRLSDREIYEIIETAIKMGINWFDTAEVYGWGASEEILSKVLKTINPKKIYIADKWFPSFRWAGNIKKTIDERLEALGGLTIDLYQIHDTTSYSSIEKQMRVMSELVDMGKIKYIGVSNFYAKDLVRAHKELTKLGKPLISNQIYYNQNNRKPETDGTLDAAKDLGIKILAYSPLDQGKLKKDALKWLIDREVIPIMGCSKVSQIIDNLS